VIVGSDEVQFSSVILCLLTSVHRDDFSLRPKIRPTAANGLNEESSVMTDKIASVRPEELGEKIGQLTSSQIREVSRGLAEVLGITAEDLRKSVRIAVIVPLANDRAQIGDVVYDSVGTRADQEAQKMNDKAPAIRYRDRLEEIAKRRKRFSGEDRSFFRTCADRLSARIANRR